MVSDFDWLAGENVFWKLFDVSTHIISKMFEYVCFAHGTRSVLKQPGVDAGFMKNVSEK